MTHHPREDKHTRWCSDGNAYEVWTYAAGYATEEEQCADHDAAVAALMEAHPENC